MPLFTFRAIPQNHIYVRIYEIIVIYPSVIKLDFVLELISINTISEKISVRGGCDDTMVPEEERHLQGIPEENRQWGSHLCQECGKKVYTCDIGSCKWCGKGTSSGAYKICYPCATAKEVCQVCLQPF